MGSRTIKVELNERSIRDAIHALESYQTWVEQKTEELVTRLIECGLAVVNENNVVVGDSEPGQAFVTVSSAGNTARAVLSYQGKDVAFIEYGAGVHYNGEAGTSPNPNGAGKGYTIGSYGKGLGKNDSWIFIDDSGAFQRSYGTKASMPMYKADMEMIAKYKQIAREVFG